MLRLGLEGPRFLRPAAPGLRNFITVASHKIPRGASELYVLGNSLTDWYKRPTPIWRRRCEITARTSHSKGTTFRSGGSSSTNTNWSRPESTPDSASLRTSMPSTALHARPSPSTTTGSYALPPMTPSSPVSGAPGGRAAAPSLSLSRRSSTNASTVPTVTRSMPYSSLYSNTTLPSLPPSTPSPGATASTDSPHRCSSPSGRSSRPGQGSLAT